MIEIKARINPISYEKPSIKRELAPLILQPSKKLPQNISLHFSFAGASQ